MDFLLFKHLSEVVKNDGSCPSIVRCKECPIYKEVGDDCDYEEALHFAKQYLENRDEGLYESIWTEIP